LRDNKQRSVVEERERVLRGEVAPAHTHAAAIDSMHGGGGNLDISILSIDVQQHDPLHVWAKGTYLQITHWRPRRRTRTRRERAYASSGDCNVEELGRWWW
jgi:D-lyxose ketol-isomerase